MNQDKGLSTWRLLLISAIIVMIFYFLARSPHEHNYHVGDKVHATTSGNLFAFSAGRKAISPVEQWLRLKVLSVHGSWVHVEYMGNPGFKPYIKAKYLTSGWITYDQYCNSSARCQKDVAASAAKEVKRAEAVKIPTAAQLKKEQEAARAHITPSYKMLSVISRINSVFVRESQQAPLNSCNRYSHDSFKCTVSGFSTNSYAYIVTDVAANFEIYGNSKYQAHVFNRIALPLMFAFSPHQPRAHVIQSLNRLIKKKPMNGRASVGLLPLFGSLSYHSEPDKIKIIAVGSPMKPYLVIH